jgi:toxin ParE1/3/4
VKVVFSSLAKKNLQELESYLTPLNPAASLKYIQEIYDFCFETLADNPYFGHTRPELSKIFRTFPIRNHIIIYRVLDETIRIIAVPHAARNLYGLNLS